MKKNNPAPTKLTNRLKQTVTTALFCLALLACQGNQQSTGTAGLAAKNLASSIDTVPEPASRIVELKGEKTATGSEFMVVTANPHASQAAYDALARGGTAIDGAIAAQMVLGLVEPQSSGIGGGGFLLYWNASEEKLYTYEGRETAPAEVNETLFLNREDGTPLHFFDAAVGGRAVGVPGIVAMLDRAHNEHGKLQWQELFSHASTMARQGFPVSERLNMLIRFVPKLDTRETISNYLFNDDGEPLQPGQILHNHEYADTLDLLANQGSQAFYHGDIARSIVETVANDDNPGALSLDDLASYEVKQRLPLCKNVFSYRVCGMAPPSSGGTTVLSILAVLDQLNKSHDFTRGSKGETAYRAAMTHLFSEASLLAFADRNTYLADSDFVDVPVNQLLQDGYLGKRAQKITTQSVLQQVKAGSAEELGLKALPRIQPASPERESTSHLSIVDQYGNALALTTSVENAFGSRLMVDGFILNNQLTDFSFVPYDADENHIANRVQGGKRPRSSMSPVIVFDSNMQPVMVLGSAGGTRIINHVARILFDVLALEQPLPDAVDKKHTVRLGPALELEAGTDEALVAALREMGHEVKVNRQTSGVHAIQRNAGGWLGVADPRREGAAMGR